MYASKTRSLCLFVLLLMFCAACVWFFSPMFQAQAQSSANSPKENAFYRDVVKKVLPAVVSIEVKAKSATAINLAIPRRQAWVDDTGLPEFRRFFDDFPIPFEAFEPARHGFGSGFIVESSGVIVTNYHVVKDATEATVHLQDGRTFLSRDIKSDPKTDLAVIRLETKSPLPHIDFGDSSAMEIGDRVLAMGAPFGLAGSVSAGIISGKGRNLNPGIHEEYLQTDAAINPGNSGGPLVNLEGKVIGVNTAIKSNSGGSQGVGLAIPSNFARNIMDRLLKEGVVQRGYLGVQIRQLDPNVAERLGAGSKTGVVVARVLEASPAAKAGIQAGDIITAFAGTPIKDPADLQRRVFDLPLKPAAVTILRDGKSQELQVTIEAQPTESDTRSSRPSSRPRTSDGVRVEALGFDLADLSPKVAQQFGYPETTAGAVITGVAPGGLAAQANLRPGTRIMKVDGVKVDSAAEARSALEKGRLERGMLLHVEFPDNGVGYVMLKAAAGN